MDLPTLTRYLSSVGAIQPWDHDQHSGDQQDDTDILMTSYVRRNSVNETEVAPYIPTSYYHRGEDTISIPWWYTLLFIVAFFVIICLSFCIREICARWCGGECSPTRMFPDSRHGQTSAVMTDRMTPEERREHKLQKQRQERRLWYQFFLKPYIVVLTADNFPSKANEGDNYEKEEEPDVELGLARTKDNPGKEEEANQDADNDNGDEDGAMTTINLNGDDERECDHDHSTDKLPTATGLVAAIEPDIKMMTLWDPRESTYRQMEANCTICYDDYEVGDTLVRSAADEEDEYCMHVFHYQCMLAWLEKGKKRCPICRHWFVPAIRIHDQMKEAHVQTHPDSLRHLYDSRTLQDILSLDDSDDDDTESNMSRTTITDEDDTTPPDNRAPEQPDHHHRRFSLEDPASQPIEPPHNEAHSPTSHAQNAHQHHHHHHNNNHQATSLSPSRQRGYPTDLVVTSDYQTAMRGWTVTTV